MVTRIASVPGGRIKHRVLARSRFPNDPQAQPPRLSKQKANEHTHAARPLSPPQPPSLAAARITVMPILLRPRSCMHLPASCTPYSVPDVLDYGFDCVNTHKVLTSAANRCVPLPPASCSKDDLNMACPKMPKNSLVTSLQFLFQSWTALP